MDSVNSSAKPVTVNCIASIAARNIFTAWLAVYLLFLPVYLLVLYIGFNKWKKPQSSVSGGLSHSDVFTLHMVAMEMICITGSCLVLCGFCTLNYQLLFVGQNTIVTTMTGQTLFHILTCLERYLAVIHPVTYLRLRGEGGVTVRNTSIALVWVWSVLFAVPLSILKTPLFYGLFSLALYFMSLPLVSYCSICVLRVLIRPKPGERGGPRKQMDQSKRSTVYTMVAILGALLLRMIYYVFFSCINIWFLTEVSACVVINTTFCLILPSSLVLPLLFLHRTGKLPNKAR